MLYHDVALNAMRDPKSWATYELGGRATEVEGGHARWPGITFHFKPPEADVGRWCSGQRKSTMRISLPRQTSTLEESGRKNLALVVASISRGTAM